MARDGQDRGNGLVTFLIGKSRGPEKRIFGNEAVPHQNYLQQKYKLFWGLVHHWLPWARPATKPFDRVLRRAIKKCHTFQGLKSSDWKVFFFQMTWRVLRSHLFYIQIHRCERKISSVNSPSLGWCFGCQKLRVDDMEGGCMADTASNIDFLKVISQSKGPEMLSLWTNRYLGMTNVWILKKVGELFLGSEAPRHPRPKFQHLWKNLWISRFPDFFPDVTVFHVDFQVSHGEFFVTYMVGQET